MMLGLALMVSSSSYLFNCLYYDIICFVPVFTLMNFLLFKYSYLPIKAFAKDPSIKNAHIMKVGCYIHLVGAIVICGGNILFYEKIKNTFLYKFIN